MSITKKVNLDYKIDDIVRAGGAIPLKKRCIVEIDKETNKKNGVYFVKNAADLPNFLFGTVLSVSDDGCAGLKIGDRVCFDRHFGRKFQGANGSYCVLAHDCIDCIVEGGGND